MFSRKLIKGENILPHVAQSRNSTNCSGSIKRSQSTLDVYEHSIKTSANVIIKKRFHPSSIYDNFTIKRVDSYDNYDTNKFRKISQILKQQKRDELNSIYRNNLKSSFMRKFGNIYLTGSHSQKQINHSSMEGNINYSTMSPNDNSNLRDSNSNIQKSIDVDEQEISQLNPNVNYINSSQLSIGSSSELVGWNDNNFKRNKIQLKIAGLYGDKHNGPSLVNCVRQIFVLKSFIEDKKVKLLNKQSEQRTHVEELEQQMFRMNYNKKLLEYGYFNTFDNYLFYIKKEVMKERDILNKLTEQKNFLQFDVDRLLEKIQKNHDILEEEIQIRDFLVRVKEKKLILPVYYMNKSLKETKKEYIGHILTKKMQTKINEVLVENIIKKYENLLNQRRRLKEMGLDFQNQVDNISNEDKIKYDKYFDKTQPIFPNSDILFNYFSSFEDKNLLLLKEHDKLRGVILDYKKKLEQETKEAEYYDKFINKHLMELQTQFDSVIDKYNHLYQKKNNIIQFLLKDSKRKRRNSIASQKINKRSNFSGNLISMETLGKLQYKDMHEKYPIEMSFLTHKLIVFIEEVLSLNYSCFTYSHLYTFIKPEEFEKLRVFKASPKNQSTIYSICIKLMGIYEFIVELIMRKHRVYAENPEFSKDIELVFIENARIKKEEHARKVKEIIDRKQEESMKEMVEKMNRALYIKNRVCYDVSGLIQKQLKFEKEKLMSISASKISSDRNENSFEQYVSYSEENNYT